MRRRIKKTFVTLIGSIVLLAGIIMIPYPGPGWVTVFAGLGILSTEYTWAQRVLGFAKQKYVAWQEWVSHQSSAIKAALWIFTALVVVATLWLLNAYGYMNDFFNLPFDWVRSPLPIFRQ